MNRYVKIAGRLVFLLVAAFSLANCTGSRKTVKEPLREEGADYLMRKLKEHELKYETFSAKFNAEYTSENKTTNVSGSLRIQRDSIIWISITPALGIEAVRFMLTPDSIKYLNRLNNKYLIQNFSFIKQLMNKTLDFDMAQSFLLGNDFSLYDSNSFKATVEFQEYRLNTVNRRKLRKYVRESEEEISIPIQSIWLDPSSFKISKVMLKEAERDSRRFLATYEEFVDVDGKVIPSKLDFKVETVDSKIRILINYSKIQIDQVQTYPFKVPESYTEIKDLQSDNK